MKYLRPTLSSTVRHAIPDSLCWYYVLQVYMWMDWGCNCHARGYARVADSERAVARCGCVTKSLPKPRCVWHIHYAHVKYCADSTLNTWVSERASELTSAFHISHKHACCTMFLVGQKGEIVIKICEATLLGSVCICGAMCIASKLYALLVWASHRSSKNVMHSHIQLCLISTGVAMSTEVWVHLGNTLACMYTT